MGLLFNFRWGILLGMEVLSITKFNSYETAEVSILTEQLINESSHPVTYNEENTLNTLSNYIENGDSDVLVVYNAKGRVLGFALVARTNEGHNEYFGYLVKFYIAPESRKSRAAVHLMRAVQEWFRHHKCVACFATATAGIGRDDAFVKLMKKFKYEEIGPTMMREEKNG